MKHALVMMILVLTHFVAPDVWGNVTLRIEDVPVCNLAWEKKIPLIMENPDSSVAAVQVDILFNTDCWKVGDVESAERSRGLDIFNHSELSGGIRIAMTGIGHHMAPGSGPIAVIIIDDFECGVGEYVLDVTNSIAATA